MEGVRRRDASEMVGVRIVEGVEYQKAFGEPFTGETCSLPFDGIFSLSGVGKVPMNSLARKK